jgi:hypothetical protein
MWYLSYSPFGRHAGSSVNPADDAELVERIARRIDPGAFTQSSTYDNDEAHRLRARDAAKRVLEELR